MKEFVDFKKLNVPELLEIMSKSKYYEEEIEELKDLMYKENDPEIVERYKNRISQLREAKRQYQAFAQELNQAMRQIEKISSEHALMNLLSSTVSTKEEVKDDKKEKVDVLESYKEEYKKIYSKSLRPIKSKLVQLDASIYKMIKENKKLKVRADKKGFFVTDESLGKINEERDTEELATRFEAGVVYQYRDKLSKDQIGLDSSHIEYDYAELGIDIQRLNKLCEERKMPVSLDSVGFLGKRAFINLENIRSYMKNDSCDYKTHKSLSEFENEYKELTEMAREYTFIDDVISIFSKTSLKDSDYLNSLREENAKLIKKYHQLEDKLDKKYEKSSHKSKVDAAAKLEELYKETQRLKNSMDQALAEGIGVLYEQKKQEYYDVRYEMIKILRENPQLNDPKYNIDIEMIIKKDKEVLKEHIEKTIPNIPVPNNIVDTKTNIPVPENIVEEKIDVSVSKELQKDTETEIMDTYNEITSDVRTGDLSIVRSTMYQQYMMDKLRDQKVREMSFSDYLIEKRPDLTELIEVEIRREKLATTIYKEYLVYFASVQDKRFADSFERFAQERYKVDNIDIPVEYEEQYRSMRSK